MSTRWMSASEAAAAVRSGTTSAEAVIADTLDAVDKHDATFNAFTTVVAERALTKARRIDADLQAGRTVGPLAGVPFAVKNLFDVAGLPTLAGSKINRDRPPAARDAALIERLESAGAVLVGTLGMGEYAYDFTGENVHYGACRNPHDTTRMTGGSSSGSGAAVAGGLVPLALGSDTNGSIRVPSSFCGTFGLKPTYGRLSRARSFPFVSSLDHLGPLARSVRDLTLAYDAMQGHDPDDPACRERSAEPALPKLELGADDLRVGRLGGYFARGLSSQAAEAVDIVAKALSADRVVELPEAERARSAAFIITAAEGGALHLERLRSRAADFDPDTRYRLMGGALVPAALVIQAQRFRAWFRDAARQVFKSVDLLVAPATPTPAPLIGQKTFVLNGVEVPARPNIGLYTQPISFIGLPVVSVPLFINGLPIGVQIIAPAWREDLALRAAQWLEVAGVVGFRKPGTVE